MDDLQYHLQYRPISLVFTNYECIVNALKEQLMVKLQMKDPGYAEQSLTCVSVPKEKRTPEQRSSEGQSEIRSQPRMRAACQEIQKKQEYSFLTPKSPAKSNAWIIDAGVRIEIVS